MAMSTMYRQSERKRFTLSIPVVAVAVLLLSIWILGISIWSQSTLDVHKQQSSGKVVSPHVVAEPNLRDFSILEDLWLDDYEDKEFGDSLHSCLDDCIPEDQETRPAKNIAILVPPGTIGLMFVDFVHAVAKVHASHTQVEVVWIPTSHLPPLGSSQPYSHILRFASLPVLLAIGDALLHVASPNELVWKDVIETTTLFVSWHCQLSLLADAAEIPMLTMTMQQISEDPLEQEMYLREFLPALEPFEEEDGEAHLQEDDLIASLMQTIGPVKSILQSLDKKYQKDLKESQLAANHNDGQPLILEKLVTKTIQDFLQGETDCPRTETGLYAPKSPMAQRVYQFLQKGTAQADDTLCKSTELSDKMVCKLRAPVFDTHSLVKEGKLKSLYKANV